MTCTFSYYAKPFQGFRMEKRDEQITLFIKKMKHSLIN